MHGIEDNEKIVTGLDGSSTSVPPCEQARTADSQQEPSQDRSQTRTALKNLLDRLGETPRQTGMLFGAQVTSMCASFLATAVQIRWMAPAEFGRYALCLSIILIAGIVMEFGLFPAGGRILALLHDRQSQRSALGALVLLAIADGVIFSIILIAIAGPIARIFKLDDQSLLIVSAAIALLLPLQRVVEEACYGLNEIRKLSVFQILMSASQLVLFLALAVIGRLTAKSTLIAYIVGTTLAASLTILRLGPNFRSIGHFAREIISEIKRYGFNAYLARITGTTTTRLDSLIVSYFLGPGPLGIYFSAQKFTGPVATMSRSLAVTRFRTFTRSSVIPARISRWNAILLLAAAGAIALVGPFAVRLLFPKYAAAGVLLPPLALMNLFQGLFQPYNIFLASHGRGADLRNIAIAFTVTSVVCLFALVPRFGVLGAAWAGVVAMAADYGLHYFYYRRLKMKLEELPRPRSAEIVGLSPEPPTA